MKDEYFRKINGILSAVTDTWILGQIYKFAINMTKDEEDFYGVCRSGEDD